MDINNIKLVIWDLDDTFWKGTLSEGEIVPIPENVQLVKDLTDRGIVNAICSKNDKAPVVQKLKDLEMEEYFVFNSIDWTPKGPRIEQMLKDMGLRAVNVLFLDDNITNLNEAKHYSPELCIAQPDVIADLIKQCEVLSANDVSHKRLKQYKVLEEKQKAKSEANDNMSFLFKCNTKVEIHEDCLAEIDRITELVNRTNQLNYTKLRSTKEELETLLRDEEIKAGYVTVKDNFGDYGIVGFYAIKNGECIHFLFSCRTIGQGVEQYVYSKLGWPELTVVGKVINEVGKTEAPSWINMEDKKEDSQTSLSNHKIVIKGACDLSIMSTFLNSQNIVQEFTFLGQLRKNEIEHHNHSVNYLQMPFLTVDEKQHIVDECVFCDPEMFHTQMYDKDVDVIFISSLIEPNLGIYRNKNTGYEIAFAEYCYPLTDPAMWDKYFSGGAYSYMNTFTIEWLHKFSENWDFVGRMTPERYVENIKKLIGLIAPQATICIILGCESPYEKNSQLAYNNRHQDHKAFNDMLRKLALENRRVRLIDINECMKAPDDFTNNINHYKRRVYYNIATKANIIIAESTGVYVKQKGKLYLLREDLAQRIRESDLRNSWLYSILKVPYRIMQLIKK